MYKVEIGLTLRRIMQIFYRFGIWRKDDESDCRKPYLGLPYLCQHVSFLIFVLTCGLLSDDKNQLMFLVEIGVSLAVVVIKLSYLLFRKDEILQFLYHPTVIHCMTDLTESLKVKNKISKILKYINAYALLLIVTIFFLVVLPLPIFTSEKKLPLFIRFDWKSNYELLLYWLTFIFTTVGCIFSIIYNCVMMLIWYIMFNYSIEYGILGNQLRRLGYPTNQSSQKVSQNSFLQDLIGLITAHQTLFNTIERFRSCFSAFFLVEIFTGAISICGSTYNLAFNTPDDLFQMTYFVVFLIYAFFDIFLILYLANEITIASDRLSYCLFESNWIEQPEANKKCVIILCEIIKQPQQLIIWIYPMNLEMFSLIVNRAYSLFNILQNFDE